MDLTSIEFWAGVALGGVVGNIAYAMLAGGGSWLLARAGALGVRRKERELAETRRQIQLILGGPTHRHMVSVEFVFAFIAGWGFLGVAAWLADASLKLAPFEIILFVLLTGVCWFLFWSYAFRRLAWLRQASAQETNDQSGSAQG